MKIRNRQSGKIKLTVATTFTLLLSVAQPEPVEAMASLYGMDNARLTKHEFAQARSFSATGEPGLLVGSNARVLLSGTDAYGEMSVIEMQRNASTRMHFNFQSNLTDAGFSATLVTNGMPQIAGGANYSLTFDLPAGQILLENDLISIITATDFAQFIPSQLSASELVNTHFARLLNAALQGSDMAGFSLSMAESLAESELLQYQFLGNQHAKGDDQYTEGGWSCAGALIALAAANALLAAAIAATYATAGAAVVTISGAVSAIGAAIVAVDQYCLQK